MRRILTMAASALAILAPAGAMAQINYDAPNSVSVAVSGAQVQAHTGLASNDMLVIALDTSNRLVFTDGGTATGDGGLYSADLSGGAPVFGTIATEAELAAATNGSVILSFNGLATIPTGGADEFAVSQFANTDDVLRVQQGIPPTVTSLAESDGVSAIVADATTVYVGFEAAFGATEDNVGAVPADGSGSLTTLASLAAITAVNGTVGVDIGDMAILPSGDVVLFSEAAFGGSDDLINITPAGVVTELVDALAFPDAGTIGTPGVSSLCADANGTIYMWNEFPGGVRANAHLVIRESDGTLHQVSMASIYAGAGLDGTGNDFDVSNNGMAARVVDANTVILYIANFRTEGDNILAVTFSSAPTAVETWSAYE